MFTATPRGGKVLLQLEMERLGVAAKNSRPYHPQTCGKVERLHQTLKRYLATRHAEGEAKVRIDNLEVMDSNLGRRQLRFVLAWAELHQEELEENCPSW